MKNPALIFVNIYFSDASARVRRLVRHSAAADHGAISSSAQLRGARAVPSDAAAIARRFSRSSRPYLPHRRQPLDYPLSSAHERLLVSANGHGTNALIILMDRLYRVFQHTSSLFHSNSSTLHSISWSLFIIECKIDEIECKSEKL